MIRTTTAILMLAVVAPPAMAKRPAVVEVSKSFGSKQCQGGGISLGKAERQALREGVRVLDKACGHDGRMRPSVCGGGDGRIAILRIYPDDLGKAKQAGFTPLPVDAVRVPCPK